MLDKVGRKKKGEELNHHIAPSLTSGKSVSAWSLDCNLTTALFETEFILPIYASFLFDP